MIYQAIYKIRNQTKIIGKESNKNIAHLLATVAPSSHHKIKSNNWRTNIWKHNNWKSSILTHEILALKELKNNKSFIIKLADKKGKIVFWPTQDYFMELLNQLGNAINSA